MARKTKKALSMKLLDEATMTYRTVHLFNVTFALKKGGEHVAQVYAPSEAEVMAVASSLYAGEGAFGEAISFAKAS